MYGDQAFPVSAPRLWNKIPNHIKLSVNKEISGKVLETHVYLI